MNYRPEIDGIRTLAIVPVLIYHLKISFGDGYLLPGGFLGVDVFLVLSGFLITKIILDEMQNTGTFSIRRFYERRARRILPALIMVTLASMFTGLFMLSPTELARLSISALAALGFVSNVYWFIVQGEYGAQSGLLQPLLHTWSLAIEEQFYLVFPLLLLWLKPMRRPPGTLVIVCFCLALSLGFAEITTSFDKQLSFFSPASRAWEFLVGSVMAVLLTHFPNKLQAGRLLSKVIPVVSVLVIVVCMVLIDLASWRHPGFITLPVVLATAGIIWCAREDELVTGILSTQLFVFIGRISYSLYLWHFPIFAFGRLFSIEKPGAIDMISWVILTVTFSIVGYYFVERRFRFNVAVWPSVVALCASLTAVAAFVIVATQTNLFKRAWASDQVALYGGQFYDNEVLKDKSWSILNELARETSEPGKSRANGPSGNESLNLWFKNDDLTNILVIGNSHSKDMFNALFLSPQNGKDFEVARFGIDKRFPKEQRKQLLKAPNFVAASIVMIAARYPDDADTFLPSLITQIQAQGKTVVVVGNTPEFVSPGSIPIYDWYIQRQMSRKTLEPMNFVAYESQVSAVSKRNTLLRLIADQTGSVFLSRSALVCSKVDKSCMLATPTGQKTMYDYGHWTLEGAQFFGAASEDVGWLSPILDAQ